MTKRWLLMFVACATAVLICMAYVDRPVADYVQKYIRHTAFFDWAFRALGLLAVALILMLIALFAAGVRLIGGRPIPAWAEQPLLMCWSGMWSLSAAIVLKRLFGRSAADPWYVKQRVYTYEWLHGAPGFEDFPSAMAAVVSALIAVVWIRAPRLRAACAAVAAVIIAALVLTNSHWVSDVIAGAFLGGSIGWMTVLLWARAPAGQASLPS